MNTINTLSSLIPSKIRLNEHYLYPGTIFADLDPSIVTTVLGSCVSVCLWDQRQNIGGINHYFLPGGKIDESSSPRFGDVAIRSLLNAMYKLGSSKKDLIAKVFGGAMVLQIISSGLSVGDRNIEVALKILKQEGIPIKSRDLGGKLGRKIKFNTHSGVVSVKMLKKNALINNYLSLPVQRGDY